MADSPAPKRPAGRGNRRATPGSGGKTRAKKAAASPGSDGQPNAYLQDSRFNVDKPSKAAPMESTDTPPEAIDVSVAAGIQAARNSLTQCGGGDGGDGGVGEGAAESPKDSYRDGFILFNVDSNLDPKIKAESRRNKLSRKLHRNKVMLNISSLIIFTSIVVMAFYYKESIMEYSENIIIKKESIIGDIHDISTTISKNGNEFNTKDNIIKRKLIDNIMFEYKLHNMVLMDVSPKVAIDLLEKEANILGNSSDSYEKYTAERIRESVKSLRSSYDDALKNTSDGFINSIDKADEIDKLIDKLKESGGINLSIHIVSLTAIGMSVLWILFFMLKRFQLLADRMWEKEKTLRHATDMSERAIHGAGRFFSLKTSEAKNGDDHPVINFNSPGMPPGGG